MIDELAFYNYKWTEAELIGSYDPQPPDSDQDGLSDQDEMLVWQTNYLDPDTDFDGMPDGAEIANGTNPLDATVFNPINYPEYHLTMKPYKPIRARHPT